jgi:hypothetical protein
MTIDLPLAHLLASFAATAAIYSGRTPQQHQILEGQLVWRSKLRTRKQPVVICDGELYTRKECALYKRQRSGGVAPHKKDLIERWLCDEGTVDWPDIDVACVADSTFG